MGTHTHTHKAKQNKNEKASHNVSGDKEKRFVTFGHMVLHNLRACLRTCQLSVLWITVNVKVCVHERKNSDCACVCACLCVHVALVGASAER